MPSAGTYFQLDFIINNFRQITASFSAGKRKQSVVSDKLLIWHSWFEYRFIKLDLVTVKKFYFHFSCVHGSVNDNVDVKSSSACVLKLLLA